MVYLYFIFYIRVTDYHLFHYRLLGEYQEIYSIGSSQSIALVLILIPALGFHKSIVRQSDLFINRRSINFVEVIDHYNTLLLR